MNYNEKTDILDIIKTSNGKRIVCNKEYKYGICVSYDIEGNPRCIRIPDISLHFGISPNDLINFTSLFGQF